MNHIFQCHNKIERYKELTMFIKRKNAKRNNKGALRKTNNDLKILRTTQHSSNCDIRNVSHIMMVIHNFTSLKQLVKCCDIQRVMGKKAATANFRRRSKRSKQLRSLLNKCINPNPAGGPEQFEDHDTMDIQHDDWMNSNCGDCAKRHKLTEPLRQHPSWIHLVHH
jgi:hypothetical protein